MSRPPSDGFVSPREAVPSENELAPAARTAVAAAEAIAADAAARIAAEAVSTAEAMVASADAAATRAAVRAQRAARVAAEVAAQAVADIALEAAVTARVTLVAAAATAESVARQRTAAAGSAQAAADLAAAAAGTAGAMVLAATAAATAALVRSRRTAQALAEVAAQVAADVAGDAAATAEAMIAAAKVAAAETVAVAATAAAAEAAVRAGLHADQDPAPPHVEPAAVVEVSRGDLALWRDIALADRLHAALRASEAQFQIAFERAPTALLVAVVSNGRPSEVLRVNHALCRLTGLPASRLLGCTLADLMHPQQDPAGPPEAGEVEQVQRWVSPDRPELWVRIRTAAMADGGCGRGQQVVCHVDDVTAQVLAGVPAGVQRGRPTR